MRTIKCFLFVKLILVCKNNCLNIETATAKCSNSSNGGDMSEGTRFLSNHILEVDELSKFLWCTFRRPSTSFNPDILPLKASSIFVLQSQAIKPVAGKVSYLEKLMSAEVNAQGSFPCYKKQTGLCSFFSTICSHVTFVQITLTRSHRGSNYVH